MPKHDALFFALQEAVAGKYSLEDELGRGGMGVVYLALDVMLDRPIALKVLPEHLAQNAALRERFLREARTAAKLSHPNIVPIHAVHEVDDFVFFAMAYVAGETLGARIRRRGPMAASECLRILRDVGFALSYAHGQGIVHRDVKPDNILLEEGTGRALVADFGIAAIAGDARDLRTGEIAGTIEFMSPEQAEGRRSDRRSDLYSLGMVGYYTLTGDLPFPAGDDRATLQAVRTAQVPPVASVVPVIPRRLARVIDRCLQRDPEKRYESADALAQALDAAVTARKQVPVAVRTFLYDPVDLGGDGPAYATIAALGALPLVVAAAAIPQARPILLAYLFVAVGLPALQVVPLVRRLLASGNTLPDLELGLRQDLEQRAEEAPPPEPSRIGRVRSIVRKWSLLGLGGSWGLYYAGLLLGEWLHIPWLLVSQELELALGAIGVASGIGYVLTAGQDKEQRALQKAERRLKFWRGPLGKLLFKIGGFGLRKKVTEVRATHRPTEVQIGLAAESLFGSLPKETRRALGDVPGTLADLETHAVQLRESIELLAEADAAAQAHRIEFPQDLQATRARAESQLAEVVAALETIRLGLLRLTSGLGTVEGVTTHLLAAGDVRRNVAFLLEGVAEVEVTLRGDVSDTPPPISTS